MKRFMKNRPGISLLEVLISIGVIALGIFGVSSLIPLAQYRVAQGTAKARQASLGQRAVSEFRVRGMNSPGGGLNAERNWRGKTNNSSDWNAIFDSTSSQVIRRGFCLDPLGVAGTPNLSHKRFPTSGSDAIAMPRITLSSIYDPTWDPNLAVSLAREICFLEDDLVFDLPDQQERQPNRQFLIATKSATKHEPVKAYSEGAMSWFATLSPASSPAVTGQMTDEFILSIVVVQERVVKRDVINMVDAHTEENFALANSQYPGEISVAAAPAANGQIAVADLAVGDWLLLVRPTVPDNPETSTSLDKIYRWTQIIGGGDATEVSGGNSFRSFEIANDDFLKPGLQASVIFMRGVKAVYEKTIRIENSSAWN